ncbi:hypothetical protein [Mycobacterium sp. URHB0021]
MTSTPTPGNFSSTISFEDIIAAWGDEVPCESVHKCGEPSAWLVDVHGCERVSACTTHVMLWLQAVTVKIATFGYVRCIHGDKRFATVEQLGRPRPL